MLFTLTNTGISAVNSAQTGGPKVTISTFQLGSGVGYTPASTDTALHGTSLYTGTVTDYRVESFDTVVYTLRVDATIGDFSFGEVGLYLSTGQLFALASLSSVQPKIKTTATKVGNITTITAKLTLSSLAPTISFPVSSSPNARVLSIASVDYLPAPSPTIGNAYTISAGDDVGTSTMALSVNDTTWSFSTHKTPVVVGGAVSATPLPAQITSTSINALALENVQAGKYILQVTSGVNRGLCRYVASVSGTTVTLTSGFSTLCSTNDTFTIYKSDYSIMKYAVDLSALSNSTVLLDTSVTTNLYIVNTQVPGLPANGQKIVMLAQSNNTGSSSITYNGQTNLIQKTGPVATIAGDIVAGTMYNLTYNAAGSYWTLGAPISVITTGSGGGGGSGSTVLTTINQVAHGFTVGKIVTINASGVWVLAQANNLATAAIGMVSSVVNADSFQLTQIGKVTGLTGLTIGTTYYLSDATAGAYTATAPTAGGSFVQKVLVADSATSGYIFCTASMPTTTGGGSLTITDDNTTNATRYVAFFAATSGTSSGVNVASTKLTFNPSTGTLNATVLNSTSDRNLKEDIVGLPYGLNTVLNMTPVAFKFKDSHKPSIGFVAQDMEALIPEVVDIIDTEQNYLGLNYGGLTAVLVAAIQELSSKCIELEAKLSELSK